MSGLPAVVSILQLGTGTLTSSAIVPASMTVAGVATTLGFPISAIMTTAFGGLPTGGATGQILNKIDATNYSTQWSGINQFVAVGTGLATSGSATSIVVSFAAQTAVSVLGVAGSVATLPAAITPSAGNQVLQSNAGNTGLVFGTIGTGVLPGPYQTGSFTADGVLYGNGTAALGVTAAGAAGLPLLGNGAGVPPAFSQLNLGAGVTGVLPVPNGGTNTTTMTGWGVVFANNTSSLGATAPATTGWPLLAQGTTSAPAFGQFNLGSTGFTGVLPVPSGGTNTSTLSAHAVLLGSGTSTVQFATATAAGNLLIDQGTGANPAFTAMSGDAAITSTGALTIATAAITYPKIATTAQYLTNTRLAKTANYTVANADKGSTISCSTNFFQVIFTTASLYDANFAVTVNNEGSRRTDLLINGGVTARVYPAQSVVVFNSNNTWQVRGLSRWLLTANATVFVDPVNGTTNTDGLASGASALLTINAALAIVNSDIDVRGNLLKVACANGTYSESVGLVAVVGAAVGGGGSSNVCHLTGNVSTPASAIISAPSGDAVTAHGPFNDWFVEGFTLKATGGACVSADAQSWIRLGTCTLGTAGSGVMISATNKGSIEFMNSFTIAAGAAVFSYAQSQGYILYASPLTATINATPTFSSFFVGSDSNALQMWTGVGFAGTNFTGTRYDARNGGGIFTNGAGTAFFPGSVAGATTAPGWYS